MSSSFDELGISPPILKALQDMGFEEPTEIQDKAIPHALKREDLIVRSKTGSGKTAVFGVSLLQLTDPEAAGPQGLILTPTRELAVQVDSDLKQISRHTRHKTTAVFGQHSMNLEIQALSRGVTIVTGTPGRVYDHIRHGNLKTRNISFLVLDEADRMLDMGFLDQVRRIIQTLPKNRVTLLFSATIPTEVRSICRSYMKNPATIEIESQTMTVDTTEQVYYRVNENEKMKQLHRLLQLEQPESCLIFCNTRRAVDRVQTALARRGYACRALHGDIPQVKRLRTLQQFKQGDFHLLVATDVAARGIHIEDLALVINYDVPLEKDGYVHRTGRTGRAGNVGRVVTLVTGEDIMSLYEIEEHIGAVIDEAELPTDEDLEKKQASIEKWTQENRERTQPQPPQAAAEPAAKNRRKKRSGPKPPERREEQRDRPVRTNTPQKAARPAGSARPARPAAPAPAKVQPSAPHPRAAEPASARPRTEPASARPRTETASARPRTETVQPQTPAAADKPFFQRVLQKIFKR
ncbi:MAG: DEAD/DEAH box helicase [Firmicutes bacterium]|nr:DEAD/DEAH box helicase [Bacillota bacterium]